MGRMMLASLFRKRWEQLRTTSPIKIPTFAVPTQLPIFVSDDNGKLKWIRSADSLSFDQKIPPWVEVRDISPYLIPDHRITHLQDCLTKKIEVNKEAKVNFVLKTLHEKQLPQLSGYIFITKLKFLFFYFFFFIIFFYLKLQFECHSLNQSETNRRPHCTTTEAWRKHRNRNPLQSILA